MEIQRILEGRPFQHLLHTMLTAHAAVLPLDTPPAQFLQAVRDFAEDLVVVGDGLLALAGEWPLDLQERLQPTD